MKSEQVQEIIFQDFQLFHDRTVSENLMFVLKATGWNDNSKMRARLNEVLMQVGLGSVEKKMPHQLSGGEQQRVVIARTPQRTTSCASFNRSTRAALLF